MALGPKGKTIVYILLGLAHFQFTIGQLSFTLESLTSTLGVWFNTTINPWIIGVAILIVYSPLVWIKNISFLAKAFTFAVSMIILSVLTTSTFAIM